MHLVVFEGSRWASLAPVSLNRPVFSLLIGTSTLLEKQIQHIQPLRVTLWVRPELEEYCRKHVAPSLSIPCSINTPLDDEPAFLTSGRTLHFSQLERPTDPMVMADEGNLVRQAYAKMPGLSMHDAITRSDRWLKLLDLPRAPDETRLPEYLWDFVHWNEEAIVADAIQMKDRPRAPTDGKFHLIAEQDVIVHPKAKISPGVVLDASKGPIVIDVGASIGANSVLQGPVYVGKYSAVSPQSHIHSGTSIGAGCKIGGEVAASIFLANSNKPHFGFVGHSYIGEWVNLGAGTTTSNLKNTYGPIKMHIGSKEIETDRRFLGSMIGDHSKMAIGTRLMTGSYVGYCSLLAASDLPPKFMPSFTFWTDEGAKPYRLDKAREMMKQMYGRRGRTWDEEDETSLKLAAEFARQVESQ
jgi:UDP-N-acetylglucosamine diphosphorylase / glucose-1-phosphate thymidylyltransferase / UDP-N-acetylgalactosamine diphosphorylase / glucosamine-1-phosphate N-acetyltransferase / galactosamine-1-phosphate N-acetyltransferase